MDLAEIFNLKFYEAAYYDANANRFKRLPLQYITDIDRRRTESRPQLELYTKECCQSQQIGNVRHIRINKESENDFKQLFLPLFGKDITRLILDYFSLETFYGEYFPKLRIDDLSDLAYLALIYEKYFVESKVTRLYDPQWNPKNIKMIIHQIETEYEYSFYASDFMKIWPLSFSFEYINGSTELWNPETFQQNFRSPGWIGMKSISLTLKFYSGYSSVYF